jgi:hypothetical protein
MRGSSRLAASVLVLCGACVVLLTRLQVGRPAVLLKLGAVFYDPRQALYAPPMQVPSDLRLPHNAGPEDAMSPEDALVIASRRIDEAYEELRRRQERLLREEEEFDMDRTGDSLERRTHQERLEAAAKELAEYARLLNSKKEAIDARRRQLEIAASSPYIAYSDAVQKAAGEQWVVPPPVQDGVQMNINVNHHKRGPVNMNINVDDRYAEDRDDKDDKYDGETPSAAEGKAYEEAHMSAAYRPDETMIRHQVPLDSAAWTRFAPPAASPPAASPPARNSNEGRALKGAAGKAKLTAEEQADGRAMLQHIRNKMDKAMESQGSKMGKARKAGSSRKTQDGHRAHRAIKSRAAAPAHAEKAAKVSNSDFAPTVPVPAGTPAAAPGHADKKRRSTLHSGAAAAVEAAGGAHGIVHPGKGKIRISKAQQLVDHLPKSVLKKLQVAENAAGVGAEGPGGGSEITGWGEGAKPAAQKAKAGKPRAAKAPAPAAGTALEKKGLGGSKLKPMFDFNFDGFGMKLAGEVQTWQPGAAAWYAYVPPEEQDDQMRRSSLEVDGYSAARPAGAGASLGFVVASALLVLGLARRP